MGDMIPPESAALLKLSFDGDPIEIITTPDGEHWAVLARLCEPFELQDHPQVEKLKALRWARVRIIRVPDARGVAQPTWCIHLRSVAGWLFTLKVGKVAEHIRPKLVKYQKDCADHLADRVLGMRVARDELNLLHGRMAALEAEASEARVLATRANEILADVYRPRPSKPGIGHGKARMLILDNIVDIARLRTGAFGFTPGDEFERAFKHFTKVADDRLRDALDFPRSKASEWSNFPMARLGEATIAVMMLVAEARDELHLASGSKQLRLPLDLGDQPAKRRKARKDDDQPPTQPSDDDPKVH